MMLRLKVSSAGWSAGHHHLGFDSTGVMGNQITVWTHHRIVVSSMAQMDTSLIESVTQDTNIFVRCLDLVSVW